MADDADIASVAALGEPVRRDLYRYVVAQPEPVGREEAAAALGVPHHVAKFNLDRLVADGLLEVEYSRPAGRGGPGAGRPAKRYRRATRDIAVTLPDRRYDLVAQVLATTLTSADQSIRTAARATGHDLGSAADDLVEALTQHGYQPRVTEAGIVLTNCPFHRLARTYTDLVCGINLDLLDALLESAGRTDLSAHLDPAPDRCCVVIR